MAASAAAASPMARLLLPPTDLGGCIHLGVERDTRGCALADRERFNHYPATPLPAISWIFTGELHLARAEGPEASPPGSPLPRLMFSGAQRSPSSSWSPGEVHAMTVSFYPDALRQLAGIDIEPFRDRLVPLLEVAPEALCARLAEVAIDDGRAPFERLQDALRPLWRGRAGGLAWPTLRGWVRSTAVRAAFTPTGAGLRRAQRRFRDWTGQSHRDLLLFARTEQAMALASALPPDQSPHLASLAADAGFADQSHLGREVRRVSGLPPGQLGERMRNDPGFWFYRLLGDHLAQDRDDPGR